MSNSDQRKLYTIILWPMINKKPLSGTLLVYITEGKDNTLNYDLTIKASVQK